jgi:hypothetical protein
MKSIARDVRRRLRKLLGPAATPNDKQPINYGQQPDWLALLGSDWDQWQAERDAAAHGPQVLIATSVGGNPPSTHLESLLAVALTLRGAQVHVLLCDAALPACMQLNVHAVPEAALDEGGIPPEVCAGCYQPASQMLAALGLKVHRYGDWLTAADRQTAKRLAGLLSVEALKDYHFEGLAVGEHALAGALRFYARGTLEAEPRAEAVWRRYFEAAVLTTLATQRLLRAHSFHSVCFNHGIYVPQGLIGEVARQHQVRVVNWNPAYRKQCFIFSHGETYHHTLLDEPTEVWEGLEMTAAMEADILTYLKSRWQGTRDWIWFHEKPEEGLEAIAAETGVDFSRPCVGLLTNVMWDAQLHYRANAFPNMLTWVLETIRYFAARPEVQLIIRIHPAEIRGTLVSRQPLLPEIQAAFPRLPANIIVIPPESPVSTYATMVQCDSVLIYGTKTGVELTSLGIPVIVAGEAWIRNKGLTLDARDAKHYFHLLDELPMGRRNDPQQIARARKYAYHFFFRRMIPVRGVEPTGAWPPYQVSVGGLGPLRPGADAGLDVISEGILNGTPFIYAAEQFTAVEAQGA